MNLFYEFMLLSIFTPFIITFLLTKFLIKILPKLNLVTIDYHKIHKPKIPFLGGLGISFGIICSEIILYFIFLDVKILIILIITIITSIIGIIDDFKTFNAYTKPILLIFAALPIIYFTNTYDYNLNIIFGDIQISIIYPILILIAISVTANTINTIDVLNGVFSGFTLLSFIPILLFLTITSNFYMIIIVMPIVTSLLAFFIFHRYPSKIFPGDTGTLTIGALYGTIAILTDFELLALIAIFPAILNSFLFIASSKGLKEFHQIKHRPVTMLPNGQLSASKNPNSPITLLRLLLLNGPASEKKLFNIIMLIEIFAISLSIITMLVI